MAGELRAPFVLLEPLAEGNSTIRADLSVIEGLSEGFPLVHTPFVFMETLIPIPVEEYMSTTPFPGFGNSVSNPAIPAGADPFSTALPGLSFNVHKKPNFNTRIEVAASGQEDRNALWDMPRWDFEVTYEFLEDSSGAASSLKTICGFFLSMRGPAVSWLFKDPDDYQVTAGQMGITDGVTTQFYFNRPMGDFLERVGQVDTANTIHVYQDGTLVDPATYTLTMPNYIVFATAPAAAHTLTATFQFFFVCRFMEDVLDFEKFYDKLWSLQTCNFRSLI